MTGQPWTAPALAAAISVLVAATAAAAIQLARTYVAVLNILEGLHRSGVAIRGAKGHLGNTQVGGGAMGQTATSLRLPTAPWSQLTDQQMRSSAAGAAAQDCGEECVAIVCQHIKRVPVPAEYIRWLWFGQYDARLSSPDDLVGMLACVDIKAHRRMVNAATAQVEITNALQAGQLAVVLGYWLSPTEAHWMVATQAGPSGLSCRDPWTGTLRTISWPGFATLFAQAYVHVDQVADLDQTRPA